LISKGDWIVSITVNNQAFSEYVGAVEHWLKSVGGCVLAKDIDSITTEGKGALAEIIEF
tara:strand:- start:791 stop:967 length:177 start_codon:yes stop_codon:yes gene_type:complete